MKNTTFALCLVCFSLSFQGCNKYRTNQQVFANISLEKEDISLRDAEIGKWYECSKDTTIIIDGMQVYEKIKIVNIQGKFIEREAYEDNGKVSVQKIPETEINICISNRQYKIQKRDIPNLDSDFIRKSVFQKINFHSITEEASTFEITFGEPDTDIIVFVLLTIDSAENKFFKIEHLEWYDD